MTPPSEAVGDALARQFRAILSVGIHPPGCLCGGGFLAPQMTAATLEEDILDYLEPRYEGALLRIVEQRRANRDTAFTAWLRRVDTFPELERLTLINDLQRIFASFAPSSRFVCE